MKIMAMLFICGRPASDVMPILASRKEALSKAYQKTGQSNSVRTAVA
jgi:hypothetical protein